MQQDDVFIACRYVTASPVTIIWRSNFLTCSFIAVIKSVYIHACHLSTSPRTFYNRIDIHKLAFKGVSDVVTNASRAIEDTRQIFACFSYASVVLRCLRIACFIHGIGAIIEGYLTSVVPQIHIYLKTCTSTLGIFLKNSIKNL